MSVKICLDPGHVRNYNRGAYPDYYEGTKMYELSLMLKEEIEKYEGMSAIITRTSVDDNPELYQRARMAKNNDCRCFLSLHTNAATSEVIKDVTVIRSVELPNNETLAWKLVDAIYDVVVKDIPVTKYKKIYTRTLDDGRDHYGVIRHSLGGCVKESLIIEYLYHTNYKQAQWLYNSNNLRKLAVATAKVLSEYYGYTELKKNDTSVNTSTSNNSPIITTSTIGSRFIYYTVTSGDSWWNIADKKLGSGFKMTELASFNNKNILSPLKPGQVIKIPVNQIEVKSYREYTIQKGDSWWGIAKKELGDGAKYKYLADYNGMSTDSNIDPGQIIKIPVEEKVVKYKEYTVKNGDSWWGIARTQLGDGFKSTELAEFNNLTPASMLKPGMIIKVPIK